MAVVDYLLGAGAALRLACFQRTGWSGNRVNRELAGFNQLLPEITRNVYQTNYLDR
jgi:hypothetical protein